MSFQEMEIKTEIEEGVSGGSNDDAIKRALDVPNISFDHEDKIPIKKEIKKEIKTEPLEEFENVHKELNDDAIKRALDVTDISFDHEDKIPIKKEIKQEIKSEPIDEFEEVHGELNDDIIERVEDSSKTFFDYEDNIPINQEGKKEIKSEPLAKDSIDVEYNSCDLDKIEKRKQLHKNRIALGEEFLEKIKQEKAKRKAEEKAKEMAEKEEPKIKAERNKKHKQFEDQEKTNSEAKKLKRTYPRIIFITYFPARFSESDLRNLFEDYGIEISSICFKRGRKHRYVLLDTVYSAKHNPKPII